MPNPEKYTPAQLKDDRDRALRSASPAIKRPASDMGAQEREEHTSDVEMADPPGPAPAASQPEVGTDARGKQDSGKRLRGEDLSSVAGTAANDGDTESVSQQPPSALNTQTTADVPKIDVSSASTPTRMTMHAADEPSVAPEQIPSIDEQVQRVIGLISEEPQDKQKGYVVSAKWLRRVQARSSFPPDGKPVEKNASEGPVGPIDNSDLEMIIEDSGALKDEAGEAFVEMRPNLSLHEDYEIFPQAAWDLVASWYGVARTSSVITRYAHDTSDGDVPNVMYELNPPVWSILKVVATHTPQSQKEQDLGPQRMSQSRYTQFQKWLAQAKGLVNIELSTKVRVWRVLGGLKSTSASGILTPAASRSASPAPGAELIASAGDKMLLDVNTFASLPVGEHREQLDVKDHTADPNYNGKVTLATLGLGRNDVIVLEEQNSKNEEWPSENVKLSIKNLPVKSAAKNLAVSGRSSPTPSIMTRGRQRKDGRPKGIVGLSNLGNTCYMNSALQCIRSVEELTQYFLHDKWKTDLNPNNPLAHNGNVAKAYAELIHQIYGDGAGSSCNPSRFKSTIGKYGPSFAGYGQQDSQEFLLFLLDGLQEDLNRIVKKPYIEKPDSTDEMVHDSQALKEFADRNWEIYKARNDSVITDLFAGMYKSTVTCPVCEKVSIIFDPFNNLTLQLPIENNWQREVIYFPLHSRPIRVDVEIDKLATIKNLKEFVAKRTGGDPDRMIMAEAYKHKFFKTFNNGDTIAETNIGPQDVLCIYELQSVPTNYNPNKKKKHSMMLSYNRDTEDELVALDSPEADKLLVPVYHRVVRTSDRRNNRPFFGQPSYLVIDREDSASYQRVLKKLLSVAANMTTRNILDEGNVLPTESTTPEDSDTVVMTDDGSSSDPKAASIQGEDGLVDVSMRDASQPPSGHTLEEASSLPYVLRPSVVVPKVLQSLFEIKVVSTGEGIPTGWNVIDENKEYGSLTDRIPQEVTIQPSPDAEENDESSADDLEDIPYQDSKTRSDTASDSGASGNQSGGESDGSLPDAADIFKAGRREQFLMKKQKKKNYSGKHRRMQQHVMAKKQNVAPQPQSQPLDRSHARVRGNAPSHDLALVRPGEALVLDWDQDAHDALFSSIEHSDDDMHGAPTWKDIPLFDDPELMSKRDQRMKRRKNGITLEDCLNEFGKSETLSEQNAWYCPRCKEHRRAHKMFELWKAPDILVMHLKRFSSNRNFRDKIEVRVDYPVEGLDLSSMVRDQTDGKSLMYDLIAVDNHYGGLGGGHYTAYAKNFINGQWHDYNDSHASAKDESSVVTSSAYLLFYRRRSEIPLGGPVLASFLSEADSEEQAAGSRDPSPVSGEGRRLGDSSHNGLSSAYPAGQAHHVGDGGLAVTTISPADHDLSLDIEAPSKAKGRAISPEYLPSYGEATASHDNMAIDDEGIADMNDMNGMSAGWNAQTWAFSSLPGTAGHANSVDGFEDASSTRGEGASPPSSLPELADTDHDDQDQYIHSEDVSDFRRLREGAPAPDVPTALKISTLDEDEGEDDLPVQELRANPEDPSGEMQFTPVEPR